MVFLQLFWKRTSGDVWSSFSIGQMCFLTPNQQCHSTDPHPFLSLHWLKLWAKDEMSGLHPLVLNCHIIIITLIYYYLQVLSSSWDGRSFGHNKHGPKIGGRTGGLCPFGGAGSPYNTMWPGLRPTFVPSGILIHPAVWIQQTWAKNWGAVPPFWGGGVESPSSTMWPGPRPTSILNGILIHNRHGPKIFWGSAPFWGRELGPHLRQCGQGRGLPACQVSSWSVQPFGHNTSTLQTDRLTGQENGPIA